MRIERVGLKDHCDVAIFRQNVVDAIFADEDVARRHFLKPGNHTHRRGLAAAGRTEQDQEFLVDDFEIKIGDRDKASEFLHHSLESDGGHWT